ncbi:hypothetical protein [Pseudoroseicyclus sp. CXY001]|uniref:hypothetical protein n=1 Tax=Pseudoroseicyclus sp. CXY001 TaxID=3242492 RepID=UPI0035710B8E
MTRGALLLSGALALPLLLAACAEEAAAPAAPEGAEVAPAEDSAEQVVLLEPGLGTLGPGDDWEPSLMGTLSGTIEAVPVMYQTWDFSVGAFDASAQFRSYPNLHLNIGAYPEGIWDDPANTLVIRADLASLSAGRTGPATVTLNGENFGEPLLTVPAEVEILSLTRGAPGSDYGTAYGDLTASVSAPDFCPSLGTPPCSGGLQLTVETRVQYDVP